MSDKEYQRRLRTCASYTPQPLKHQDCMVFGPNCGGPIMLEQRRSVIKPVYPFMEPYMTSHLAAPHSSTQCGASPGCQTPMANINPPTPPCNYFPQCTVSGKHLYPSKWAHQPRSNPMTVPVADNIEFYKTTMNQGPLSDRSEVCDAMYQRVYDLSSGYQKCPPYIINEPSIGP
jgi:hypothetical protein